MNQESHGTGAIGREARQWAMACHLVALVISLILALIGFMLFFLVMIFMTVFPIIGAIKANEGVHYRYPITIRFIK